MKRALQIIIAALYIAVLVWSYQYNLAPLIAIYGGWAWIGTNVLIFIAGFALSVAFIFSISPEKKPQATYKNIPDPQGDTQ